MKSIEQRLYEAYRANRGIRLSATDVFVLVRNDAIGTAITNAACLESGVEEEGQDRLYLQDSLPTWRKFVERMRDE